MVVVMLLVVGLQVQEDGVVSGRGEWALGIIRATESSGPTRTKILRYGTSLTMLIGLRPAENRCCCMREE
jgi:hypothetical protein